MKTISIKKPPRYSLKEAAFEFRVTVSTLRRWIREGKLPYASKIKGKWLIDREELEAEIADSRIDNFET